MSLIIDFAWVSHRHRRLLPPRIPLILAGSNINLWPIKETTVLFHPFEVVLLVESEQPPVGARSCGLRGNYVARPMSTGIHRLRFYGRYA